MPRKARFTSRLAVQLTPEAHEWVKTQVGRIHRSESGVISELVEAAREGRVPLLAPPSFDAFPQFQPVPDPAHPKKGLTPSVEKALVKAGAEPVDISAHVKKDPAKVEEKKAPPPVAAPPPIVSKGKKKGTKAPKVDGQAMDW